MASGDPQVLADWSGGVNPNAGPYLLNPNQAKDARNVNSAPLGSFKKRGGFVDVATGTNLTSLLDSVHSLAPVNITSETMIAVGKQAGASSDRIVSINPGGTCTTLKSGLTQGKRWEWVQGTTQTAPAPDQGPMFGLNGFDTPQAWDGSGSITNWTADTGSVPTACTYLIYHDDRFWAAGDPSHPGRVFYSGLDSSTIPAPDPRNWDSDFYVDIEPDDGQIITGLGKVGPYIVVFKSAATYVITDPVTGANRRISSSTGCSAHRSIAETPQGTFFLSEDQGVCRTDGQTVDRAGENVLTFTRGAADANPATLPFSAGIFHQNSYYLSIPYVDSENDITLEYDQIGGGWWPHTATSNQFARLDPSGTPRLYSASAQATTVQHGFVSDTFTDSGVAFDWYLQTSYQVWGEPHLNKRVAQFRVDGRGTWSLSAAQSFSDEYEELDSVPWEAEGSTGTFGTDDDLGTDDTFGGSGVWGVAPGIIEMRYYTPLSGVGRAWSLQFSGSDSSDTEVFSLSSFLRGRTD